MLNYINTKIKGSNLKTNDVIYEEIDYEWDVDFSSLSSEFFENRLNFQDLNKYENIFDDFGIDLDVDS